MIMIHAIALTYFLLSFVWLWSVAGIGYGSIIPDSLGAESHSEKITLAEKISKFVDQYIEAMEKVIIWTL